MSDYPIAPLRSTAQSEDNLQGFWTTLRQGWLSVALVLVFSVGVAGALNWLLRETYEGTATLRLGMEDEESSLLSQLSPLAQFGLGGMSDEIETDIGILESRSVAEEVVDSLNLQLELVRPAVPRDSVMRILSAPRELEDGRYRFERSAEGRYSLAGANQPGGSFRPGEAFQLGGATVVINPPAGTDADVLVIDVLPFDEAVDELRENIDIQRHRGSSTLVDVDYRTRDRILAAAVPNAISNVYLRHTISSSRVESGSRVQALRTQVADYEQQLRAAEEELRRYREQTQLIEPKAQATAAIERLALIRAERDALQIERDALARVMTRMQSDDSGSGAPGSDYRRLASFPSFISNTGVQEIIESLITLENDRAALLVLRTSENRDVQALDTRITELDQQLFEFASAYLDGLQNQIASATEVLDGYDVELAAVPGVETDFLRLMREQELLTELYVYLQTRLKEAEIAEATELGTSRVVDSARVPRGPISPRPLLNLALASVLGLMLGATLVIGRRLADRTVRTPNEAELASGLPVLGVIPAGAAPARVGLGARSVAVFTAKEIGNGSSPHQISQAYRSLGALMMPRREDQRSRLLLVSRTGDAEESASVAANLAVTFAEQGHRVLLIDADLGGRSLSTALGSADAPGLLQIINGSADLARSIRTVDIELSAARLFLLPAGGSLEDRSGTALASAHIEKLLVEVRDQFDLIVVSAPPASRLNELVSIGSHADLAILAAHIGMTDKADLEQAVRRMHQLGLPLRGIVLRDPAPNASWSAHRLWLPNLAIHGNGKHERQLS